MSDMFNILIVKCGSHGDVVRTSYVLPGLSKKYNPSRIYWLTSGSSFDLLRYNPYVEELCTPEFNQTRLRGVTFDLVFSLDDEVDALRSFEGLRFRRIVGALPGGGQAAYTEDSAPWFDMGLISRFGKERADDLKKENRREHNEILASMLDIEIRTPRFYNSSLIEKRMSRSFRNGFFKVGLNSGAGSRWPSKRLPMAETIRLVDELLSMKIGGRETCVYLLGGAEEAARHEEIRRAVPSERLVDTGNENSLLEFAAIIRHCDYMISSDSLALHLAVSQGVRNASFYAPTSAAEIGTFGTGVKVLSQSDDYCSYRGDADNSTITARRILDAMKGHLEDSFDTGPGFRVCQLFDGRTG